MFTLKINGEVEPFSLEQETTFGQVMEKLSARMNRSGKVITDILMNNRHLTGGKQVEYYMFPLTDVETIELSITEPVTLALKTLSTLSEFQDEIKRNCLHSAELFRLGDELEANELYSRLIEDWRWLLKGFEAIALMLKLNPASITVQGQNINQFQNNVLLPIFDEMLTDQKRADWIALADQLEFEIIPALDKMSAFYAQINQFVSVDPGEDKK